MKPKILPSNFICSQFVVVLLLTFVCQASLAAEYFETFENYAEGTIGSDIENIFLSGLGQQLPTIELDSSGASKELCVATPSSGVSYGFSHPTVEVPFSGIGSMSVSSDFRFQIGKLDSAETVLLPTFGGYWVDFQTQAWTSLAFSEGEMRLALGGSPSTVGTVNPVVELTRPISEFEFASKSEGEWSEYFTFQHDVDFEVEQGAIGGGVTTASFLDSEGNVLMSVSQEMLSLSLLAPQGEIRNTILPLGSRQNEMFSAVCHDNLRQSVSFTGVPEPSAMIVALTLAARAFTVRRRR